MGMVNRGEVRVISQLTTSSRIYNISPRVLSRITHVNVERATRCQKSNDACTCSRVLMIYISWCRSTYQYDHAICIIRFLTVYSSYNMHIYIKTMFTHVYSCIHTCMCHDTIYMYTYMCVKTRFIFLYTYICVWRQCLHPWIHTCSYTTGSTTGSAGRGWPSGSIRCNLWLLLLGANAGLGIFILQKHHCSTHLVNWLIFKDHITIINNRLIFNLIRW